MIYGLLGKTLGHSFSPEIHHAFAAYSYGLYEKEEQDLAAFLSQKEIGGLNVTIPYKQTVMPYCDVLSPIAARIGSVNTLTRKNDGLLYGDNTDYYGFCYMLERNNIVVRNKKVLLLGSGGTSRTAQVALEDLGAKEIIVVSRRGPVTYADLSMHADAEIIINTTPVGMYPDNLHAPISLSLFPACVGVVDVIYNPLKTAFILEAEEKEIPTATGLSMLVAQAKRAVELFLDTAITTEKMENVLSDLERQRKNIVLIGMPGSGKSCTGKEIALQLNRPFIDMDALIAKEAGTSIPTIFAEKGEEYFRILESQLAKRIGKNTGHIIATGGGVVTRKENYAALTQNSKIYFIARDIDQLAVKGRPISLSCNSLEALYAARKEHYNYFADQTVKNDTSIAETAKKICEDFYEIHDTKRP
ncbi:MAG: shikimate kinase [Christensenellaceae bacterium]|jgi:shikimate dehydrogenase